MRAPSTFVCAVTPFAADGSLDEAATAALVDRIGAAGAGVYVGGSSPGEGYALTLAETERLYGAALAAMAGRAPVRAMGVEPRTAADLVERLRVAEAVGLDGVQLYSLDCGHANRPTDAELERYFRTLLESLSVPAVVSSHLAAGYLVPLPVLDRLLDDYPHLVGVNCTTPDLGYLSRLVERAADRADVHVGGPMQALTVLALGGQGFLSADGNLVPALCTSVIDYHTAGEAVARDAAYALLMKVFRINAWGGSMRWLKAAMRVLGLPGHHLRPPYLPLDDAVHERIRTALAALDLPELAGRLDATGTPDQSSS